jgi:hypothetical protein
MTTGRILLAAALAASVLASAAGQAHAKVTDADVQRAIDRGKEYLIGLQQGNGAFGGGGGRSGNGPSSLAFMTLAYMGMHPNRDVMAKALQYHMDLDPDTQMDGRAGYVLPIRLMGLAYVHNKLLGERRDRVRRRMYEDVLRIKVGQTPDGGWRYPLRSNSGWDFSNSQWPILGYREAAAVGIEIPEEPLYKARELYYEKQNPDGGYHYQGKGNSYGSMSAAGIASLYIIRDLLDPGSGCPCSGGSSKRTQSEIDRRIDMGLDWMSKNYDPATNPGRGNQWHMYWLYCAERVGINSGFKYWGDHDWYAEGAEYLVRHQKGDGSWGQLVDTCFALLFLVKGRAPLLFNKLKFDGLWNMHRADVANLTYYITRTKEQLFQWQIVEVKKKLPLEKNVEELHEAPVLFISAESVPKLTPLEKQVLRRFTDTGGTILLEPSCGNATVKRAFMDLAKELWPEWRLGPIGTDHGVYTHPHPLPRRPEVLGVSDGVRTSVFLALDDISCPWHTKAYASKGYLFDFGINLFTYATDGAPLRAKLQGRSEPKAADKHAGPVKAGGRRQVRLARVKHAGNWEVGANYGGFEQLAAALNARAGVALEVTGPKAVPFNEGGVPATGLAGYDAAYFAGSGPLKLTQAERDAIKTFADGGGFLWFEAAMGSHEFDKAVQDLAGQMGWKLEVLPATHDLMTGRMGAALGHNLTTRLEFRKSLRVVKLGRAYADLIGVFASGRLIGVYSPLDVMFSVTPYEAYKCKGYLPEDAEAVATNIVLYLTTLGK